MRFFGCEGALFLSWGVAANVALLAILERRGDFAIYDKLVQASMHEGLSLTRVFFSDNGLIAAEGVLKMALHV
jgi:7-keto-8-aminopelargonate synthetase-like enzyme